MTERINMDTLHLQIEDSIPFVLFPAVFKCRSSPEEKNNRTICPYASGGNGGKRLRGS